MRKRYKSLVLCSIAFCLVSAVNVAASDNISEISSDVVMIESVGASSLEKVSGLKQTGYSNNAIKVEWTAPSDTDCDYEVYVSTSKTSWGTPVAKSTDGDTERVVYSLKSGTTYYVKVRAYTTTLSSDGTTYVYTYSPDSEIIEVVTSPNASPRYIKKVNSTTTSITLEWSAVSGANAYYIVYQKEGATKNEDTMVYSTNTTTVKAELSQLSKNSEYYVCVYPTRVDSTKKLEAISSRYKYGKNFSVTPSKVTNVSVPYYWSGLGKIKVEHKNFACADGYQTELWTAYKSKDSKIATTTGLYIINSSLCKHNFFKVRVRAWSETSDGKKKYGAWSDWKYVCQQPDVTKISSSSKGLTIKYDKITGADRYVVYMSKSQNSGYKKVATTTKTSCTVNKFNNKALVKGKYYYVYVVAYNKVGSKYYSGETLNATACWRGRIEL